MNPLFDLIVIGIIISMVWLNLHFSKEPSSPAGTWWSTLREKFMILYPVGHKPAFAPYVSSQD